MTDIYLVRHGEAAATWAQSPDPGLSQLGHQQAHDVAQALAPKLDSIDVSLITSPMLRARETAQPLANHLQQDVAVLEAFREIQAPVPLADRQRWLRAFMQQQWEEQPEALHTWRDRAFEALLALSHSAVIFTHFLVINALVGQITNEPTTLCCWPDNGSMTHLRLEAGALSVVALGKQLQTRVN
ncbi:MAG: histidine phosphatase family protein [Pseudomonadota bacterium]